MKYDLDLFLSLNEEYRLKPLVPIPPKQDLRSRTKKSLARIARLKRKIGFVGIKRLLDIGCGRGDLVFAARKVLNCEIVGVDVRSYPEWFDQNGENVGLLIKDISQNDNQDLGKFDRIISFSVWEHIRHPVSALEAAKTLLNYGGKMFMSANLYRGPKASHRYREVFFPWPHLLFTDEVFQQFYIHQKESPNSPAWVNHLSRADYHHYFNSIGLSVVEEELSRTPIDEQFYCRFEDVLSKYPRLDLEIDFMNVTLVHKESFHT